MKLSRRTFIRGSLAGGILLAGAAYLARPAPEREQAPPDGLAYLGGRDATVVAAIAPSLLGVSLDAAQQRALLARVDGAIMGLPLAARAELRELLDLLGNAWGRRYLAGVVLPWQNASAAEIAAFLDGWRLSPFVLLRSGYQALHGLIAAAWYSDRAQHAAIGYAIPDYAKVLAA